ncbi:MAG: 4-alpha-glucanotransferase [Anaerolineae bacterium]|jgi:4-alpha-glucanotransferase|nr:4-alpha-glucanotransferase [Anaerolineae bacterium]MDH7472842.1 4-alpha-glucanotransferase [Anaerolineae bacterium]
MVRFPRCSGILLHPTSLPGRFGIGDLGDAAYRFVDFLAAAGQSYWQVLPLSPTGYGDSPYQGLSAFAGNPLLISPEKLVESGHLSEADLEEVPAFPAERVDFGQVIQYKTALLDRAFANFRAQAPETQRQAFSRFCAEQAFWLNDFALFMALKATRLQPWYDWEPEIVTRQPEALAHWQKALADEIEGQKYRQWQFFEQWLAVKRYANERGIRIIGDIPIFVARDSVDVWANPHLFHLDEELKPTVVSGVPPDYFSETGQLWGHPHYRWEVMARDGYAWWITRFRMAFTQADVVRIDHFRGFYNYWEVPVGEATAVKGRWVYGPAADLFRAVTAALGEVAIIAEDLGDFDEESRAGVDALRAEFGYPGMKVLQFAFGGGPTDPFLPHNFTRDFVVYTGTHDNDTIVGWYQETSTEAEREYARKYLNTDGSDIAWDLIRLAWASVANTAITTAQDLLSLGHSARLNTPSTTGAPNWCWRLLPGALTDEIAARLRELTFIYGRI